MRRSARWMALASWQVMTAPSGLSFSMMGVTLTARVLLPTLMIRLSSPSPLPSPSDMSRPGRTSSMGRSRAQSLERPSRLAMRGLSDCTRPAASMAITPSVRLRSTAFRRCCWISAWVRLRQIARASSRVRRTASALRASTPWTPASSATSTAVEEPTITLNPSSTRRRICWRASSKLV
ncbi:hypothetical protein FQZ97_1087410 [compost metagenome]